MRSDMKKVIKERPRRKGSDKTPKAYARSQNKPLDDFPQKESISRKYGYNDKGETFRDGPLRKFLESKVGYHWDNIYSEICANADIRSHGGYQVRQMIEWMVDFDVVLVDGVPYDGKGYKITSYAAKRFYVDPLTKLLCVAPQSKKWVKEKKLPKIYELDGILYHCHEDAWYRVKMVDLKDWTKINLLHPMYIQDAFIGGSVVFYSKYVWDNGFLRKYGKNLKTNKIWYCIHKESANKKEIRKLKKLMEKYNE